MRDIKERPVCHRAEDLVTYLYGEAGEADTSDFANHLQQCDACRSEFAVFNQVHDSILMWRNEALGSSFNPAALVTESTIERNQFVHERKLSALAALREFFSVSPLWLRGATAFAALLLCVLAALTISRMFQSQPPVAKNETQPNFSQQDIDRAVQKAVDEKVATWNRANPPNISNATASYKAKVVKGRTQTAVNSAQPRAHRLTRAEREQLAADLRLTPGRDEEELPFVFPDEPNQ